MANEKRLICKKCDHFLVCKHYHQYHVGKTNELCEWGKCQLISMDVDMPESGFCSYGERREGE